MRCFSSSSYPASGSGSSRSRSSGGIEHPEQSVGRRLAHPVELAEEGAAGVRPGLKTVGRIRAISARTTKNPRPLSDRGCYDANALQGGETPLEQGVGEREWIRRLRGDRPRIP